MIQNNAGARLRAVLAERDITPFIGIYDLFSASVASRHFDGLFVSGFGFAASHYGLPDIGFICWSDMVANASWTAAFSIRWFPMPVRSEPRFHGRIVESWTSTWSRSATLSNGSTGHPLTVGSKAGGRR